MGITEPNETGSEQFGDTSKAGRRGRKRHERWLRMHLAIWYVLALLVDLDSNEKA